MDADDRDVVQSYAPNLAKQEGRAVVRLDIPAHLRHTFRLLDSHGAELKKRRPTTKRSIKFEDATRSLVLDVRINEEEGWCRIDPAMTKEARFRREKSLNHTGQATPGGKAGRRALTMPSQGSDGFEQGGASDWTQSEGSNENDATYKRTEAPQELRCLEKVSALTRRVVFHRARRTLARMILVTEDKMISLRIFLMYYQYVL